MIVIVIVSESSGSSHGFSNGSRYWMPVRFRFADAPETCSRFPAQADGAADGDPCLGDDIRALATWDGADQCSTWSYRTLPGYARFVRAACDGTRTC